jgi:hypothetical protein
MRKLRRAARIVFGHSDAPRAPVLVLAGMMPEPPGSEVYLSARGCRTRSAIKEYPPCRRPFNERGSAVYCRRFRQVKGVGISFDESAHLAQYGFQRVRRTPMIRMAFRHGRARPGHPRFWCGKF